MKRPSEFGGTLPLFGLDDEGEAGVVQAIGAQAFVLRGFARKAAAELFAALHEVERQAPFRHMKTPGGLTMSVALTNCGELGWISDERGYRYGPRDPFTGERWPPMPESFRRLAEAAAAEAGFPGFDPDACLVNLYEPGSKLTLHQDKNERDFNAPIVSVSLGAPATFLFGGHARGDRTARVPLRHGDVVVWGGVDRLRFHGVLPLKAEVHGTLGARRFNFTLRRAR